MTNTQEIAEKMQVGLAAVLRGATHHQEHSL